MRLATLALGLSAVAFATFANAAPTVVANGGFEMLTSGPGQLGYNTNATSWTSGDSNNPGYNFVFAAGTGDTTGSQGQYGGLSLWGPNNGSANGLPAASPFGGNYLALDGAFDAHGNDHGTAVSQTLSGLMPGQKYAITFAWAGAQQQGFNGDTTEGVQVSFGTQTQTTAGTTVAGQLNNVSHGFTGWQKQTFVFTAQTANDVLSFLALGTPAGLPPFVLLDGITGTAVPEAATIGLMGLGLGLVAVARRRK